MNYHIPANYSDAGKLLGMFEVRNSVETVVMSVPILYLCFTSLPFSLTTNIIVMMIVVIPISGFALIGINDDCLTRFARTWLHWHKHRGIITFRGNERIKERRYK